ncbi:MAG: DUF3726 domain-containing protein [Pseudomonadota bacterium]
MSKVDLLRHEWPARPLDEIEGLGARAARGAGYNEALSGQAGRAARWLAARGLPGPEALRALLVLQERSGGRGLHPVSLSDSGADDDGRGTLCPISVGAALAASPDRLSVGERFVFATVAYPMLALPAIGLMAQSSDQIVGVAWHGLSVILTAKGLSLRGDQGGLHTASATSVVIGQAPIGRADLRPSCDRRAIDPDVWAALEGFAARAPSPAGIVMGGRPSADGPGSF